MSPRGPLQVFEILQQNGIQKNPKGPPLHFLALCDLPETYKIRKFREFFEVLLSPVVEKVVLECYAYPLRYNLAL